MTYRIEWFKRGAKRGSALVRSPAAWAVLIAGLFPCSADFFRIIDCGRVDGRNRIG